MAKPHRGKTIRRLPNRGRGLCPVCGRTGVKLLYTLKAQNENLTVCKRCYQSRSNQA